MFCSLSDAIYARDIAGEQHFISTRHQVWPITGALLAARGMP
jgi:hypothetical protein